MEQNTILFIELRTLSRSHCIPAKRKNNLKNYAFVTGILFINEFYKWILKETYEMKEKHLIII